MIENYSFAIESFARRYYIKSFEKKYHRAWDITLKALISQFERVDMLLKRDVAEIIINRNDLKIIKSKFSVAGTMKSPNSSGNRCIIAVDEVGKKVFILLVYHKNNLSDGNETVQWKKIIKDNYQQYSCLF